MKALSFLPGAAATLLLIILLTSGIITSLYEMMVTL